MTSSITIENTKFQPVFFHGSGGKTDGIVTEWKVTFDDGTVNSYRITVIKGWIDRTTHFDKPCIQIIKLGDDHYTIDKLSGHTPAYYQKDIVSTGRKTVEVLCRIPNHSFHDLKNAAHLSFDDVTDDRNKEAWLEILEKNLLENIEEPRESASIRTRLLPRGVSSLSINAEEKEKVYTKLLRLFCCCFYR